MDLFCLKSLDGFMVIEFAVFTAFKVDVWVYGF